MRRRLKIVLLTLAATVLISFPIFENPDPVLLWNASASAPVGLYRVRSIDKLGAAELVVARPPAPLADLLEEGGYLPRGVLLIERVLGLAGQTIRRGRTSLSPSMKSTWDPHGSATIWEQTSYLAGMPQAHR
jgi:type IV secretory pathway protease TraF